MKRNERLIYTNANGETLEISWFSPYVPLDFSDSLDLEITTDKNNLQDGENAISDSLNVREISIKGFIELEAYNTLERRLKKVFNPKLSGKLVFSDGESERYLDVRVMSLPEITRKMRMAEFDIDLVAHFPYWREKEKTEYVALLQNMLTWPVVFPAGGMVFGLKRSVLETKVYNIGDAESGFRVIFKAKGSVRNPAIRNCLTDEKIKLRYDMKKGDVIEVINQPYNKMVYVNGAKAFRYLDRLATTFFGLAAGENTIGYQADENTVNLDVIVYYSPLYL